MILGRVSAVEALDVENFRARVQALFSKSRAPKQFPDGEIFGFAPMEDRPAAPAAPRASVPYLFSKSGDSLDKLIEEAWNEIAELASAPGRVEWELFWRCLPRWDRYFSHELNEIQQRLRVRFFIMEPTGADDVPTKRTLVNA